MKKELKHLKKYKDFGVTDNLTRSKDFEKAMKKVKWTKYKIVVPTEKDRLEIMDALEHLHDSHDIDTDYVTVNQLVHEYGPKYEPLKRENYNIIVDKKLYASIKNFRKELIRNK